MILYRALNKDDLTNYLNGNHIYCSLFNASRDKNMRKVSKNFKTYYELCLLSERKYALDSVIGHVSGKKLGTSMSPWVSVSSDYDFVMEEYAVPQSGTYNYERGRKPILAIVVDDRLVINNSKDVKDLRETNRENFILDLRNGLLREYFNDEAILSEKYNENMPGYDLVSSMNREVLNNKTDVFGYSNFTTTSNELLVFAEINKNSFKILLSPLLQDIIYGSEKDAEVMIHNISRNLTIIRNAIERLYNTGDPFLKILYPGLYGGENLTDILIVHYDKIEGNTLEEKYETLKRYKLKFLNLIDYEINNVLKTNLTATRVVDDKVIVSSYDNLKNIPFSQRHDIVLIEKDNKLYPYDYTNHSYITSDDYITKNDVKKLLKK